MAMIGGRAHSGRKWWPAGTAGAALAAGIALPGSACAHTAERGLVLLLPTGYYLWGGAIAVAASFAILAFTPPSAERAAGRLRRVLSAAPPARDGATLTSLASFAVMVVLIAAGLAGSRDPLANPLPLAVWTVFWVGLTLAHAVFGNLWHWLNPWSGPVRLVRALGLCRSAPFRLPERVGHLPAILGLLAFTWAELVDPAPDDTRRLALAVAIYWTATLAAMCLFGEDDWRRRGECFSVFFGLIALLAPLGRDREGRLVLALPGARAMGAEMPAGRVLFVLLALASVSFDGLDGTFWYLGLIGVNPLEFPGRSAVVLPGTLGLLATWAAMSAAFYLAILAGIRLRPGPGLGAAAGAFVVSLLPISLAYHFAHYLTLLLVNGQYALAAASDPFGTGADLFGFAELHVTTSFLNRLDTVSMIWDAQAGAIILGHVWAVLLAHAIALRLWPDRRAAVAGGLPLALLMVGYTVFGLWLLSAPTGA